MTPALRLTRGQRWLLSFTNRFGALAVVVLTTVVSVALSLALTTFSLVATSEPLGDAAVYLIVATGIPLVVAPLVSTLTLRLLGAVQIALEELDRAASTDDLTGLANRRRFFEVVEAWAAALGDGESLLVGMVDLDRFKEINDTFGHAIGDAALRAVAGRLRTAAGPDALVARLGGDELACVLPAARAKQEGLAQAIVTACSGIAIGEDVRVSASVGFSRIDRLTGVDAALAVADAELYAVKGGREGRPTRLRVAGA